MSTSVDFFEATGTSPPGVPERFADAPTIRNGQTADGRLFCTVAEAAALLGLSRTNAFSLVRSGAIPSKRLGRRVLIPVAALLAFADTTASESGVS